MIAIPSEEWGEQVHAIVILREALQATSDDIIAHCQLEIAHYKCPRSVEFRSEPFPLSGAGKVLKRELRKPYWERRSRQVS
ncbi:MAG: AMP-binding enzyme [Beijerinckiaceae bacterium]